MTSQEEKPNRTLLLIDDDPDITWTTTRMLEEAGYTVVAGASIAEGAELTRKHCPALLLLDIDLPDGNGMDLARRIKLDPGLAGVFVVLVSGVWTSPQAQATGLKCGLADGFIVRPFTKVDFLARIEAFLRIRSTQESLRKSEHRYRMLFQTMNNGFALHEIIRDAQGNPCDYRFLDVNQAFARLVGMTPAEVIGSTVREIALDGWQFWSDVCRTVALSGDSLHSAQYVAELLRHFEIEAYAPQPGQVAAIITDVTAQREAATALRGYARHMIELEEELRRKLAAELHDEIGRDLSAIGINLSLLSSRLSRELQEDLRSRLSDSEELLKGVTRTVRTMMGMLRPPVLDDYGLPAALRWHGDLIAKRHDIAVSVQVEDEFPRISAEHELTLFRITQEALANAARHAEATEVTVRLYRDPGEIVLAISDNGTGFVPQRNTVPVAGWGLTIMRERAELAGGCYLLESAPGAGTRISVTLPEER